LCKKVLHAISRFIIAYPFLWIISILPFRIFYWLSDGVYFLVYYIIGYRKKVVRANLALALPHLSDKERVVIEKIIPSPFM
jgi:KDO2-lipid IV(A) lauroyltransferase